MSDRLKTIRWRLLTGVLALVAAVAVTLPAAASKVDLGKRVADIWPNGDTTLADIWPNGAFDGVLSDVIWPNAGVIGGIIDGSSSDQGNQDTQASPN
ncbi:MAG TPA: hypothetical protein VIT43_06955 [Candidatus Dormibacteraeota bacterium]